MPWTGPRCAREGLGETRLLVLGESHYGTEDDETSDFTIIAKLILGKGACATPPPLTVIDL